MRVCICTTPIRPYPTDFPPFGSMAIIQAIRDKTDLPVEFYNIDYHRPSDEQIKTYFRENSFEFVGISAVVSTAYAYVKYLSALIKKVSPKTRIIVGGNLAASAEILLRKCPIDFCVVGDGEIIAINLLNLIKEPDFGRDKLKELKGIFYLEGGKLEFTGYGEKPSADEVTFPDYEILERDGSINYFVTENVEERLFAYEGTVEKGKRVATVVMTKGCVARCTFCHRWEKGFRVLPVPGVIGHIKELVKKYNVGFVQVADENFGSNREEARAIASQLGELGLLWQVAGVRTNTVTKETLQHWKDNGCLSVYYGIESGSQKILDIMEKKTTVAQNIDALKWTGEVGLNTVIQLIIGMPGEDDQTLAETIEFLNVVSPFIRQWEDRTASDLISINYAQALPGTPLYEYGRENGLIGRTVEEEEKYLFAISDTDAYSDDHFVNMTDVPLLKVLAWRQILMARIDAYHLMQTAAGKTELSVLDLFQYYTGIIRDRISKRLSKNKRGNFAGSVKRDFVSESGYFNISAGLKFSPLLLNPYTRNLLSPAVMTYVFIRTLIRRPRKAVKMLFEQLLWSLGIHKNKKTIAQKSLRKTINIVASNADEQEKGPMLSLRQGR